MQRIGRRWRAFGLISMWFLMGVTSAESQDLNALFSSSTNLTTSQVEGTTTDLQTFNQTLDLNWNRSISPSLRYRISLRGQDNRSRTKVESDLTHSSSSLLEPVFDVTLSSTAYSLNAGLRLRERITDGNEVQRTRLSDRRWFTRLFLTPEGLPSLSFQVDRRTSANDLKPKTEDKVDTRYQISTAYANEGFDFSYIFSDRIDEDFVTGQTRDRMSHVGTLGYAQSFWGGWLTVLGGYTINYSPTREEFSSSGTAEVERRLSRGLKAAADLSPADSSDVPLADEPGLISGTALVPLDLNTSVGFEQITRESVAQIRLDLSPQASFTIPDNLELFVNFRVFFTDDLTLTTWTELGGVSQRFDSLEGRFILTFPSTTSRFFKVYVSRNDFGALIRATGIIALDLQAVGAGEKRSRSSLLHNFNSGFTIAPASKPWTISTLSYNFSLNDLTQEPNSTRNTDGTHTARLTAEPHRLLRSTFTYQHSFSDSNQVGGRNTTTDLYSLIFSSTPLPTLTGSLSLLHNDNRSEGKLERRVDSGNLNISAQLYRNLNLDSTYSISRSEDFLSDQKTLRHTGRFNASATLTPTMSALLGYTIESAQTEQPDLQTNKVTHTASGSFTYTISRFLNINTRYDLLRSTDTTSFSQEYRLDWTPTSKLSSFFNYRRVQQDTNGMTTGSDSMNITGRWGISRYINMDASFLFFRSFSGDTVYSFAGTAQFRF